MNEIVKSQSSTPVVDYKKRTKVFCWELSYGYKDKFYLSEVEKDLFLNEILNGKDVVVINGNVFTRFFKSLVITKSEEDKYIKL